MARLELSDGSLDDLDRFVDHLQKHESEGVAARIDALVDALDVLVHSPLIGRPVRGGKREFVIGSGHDGYVALYRHVARVDTVFVLAFRSQREASYPRRGR
jgi:plasmid stabilization system protein ParE